LCDLYHGDLLEGFVWEEPEAREWLEVQRAKLRDAFVSAVSTWIEAAGPTTDKMSLRIAARRLIEVEPYNETAHRALMRLFAGYGEPARVREVYRTLEERLRTDLGVKPDTETTELLSTLLDGRSSQGTSYGADALPAAPVELLPELDGRDPISPAHSTFRSGTPRITILPPVAIGGQDYGHQLATSLIEDVTIGLCRFKSLSVVAPHTAWELSQNGKKALLRSFRIDYAVETQLLSLDGELQLAVKLVNAVSRDILWVEQYAFSRESMARQYRDLSVRIVSILVDTIERVELAPYDVEQDPTAYHLFLTGQKLLRTLDLPSIRKARRAFKLAVNSCSDFVPAISGLAQTCNMEWLLMARADYELLGEAERLSRRSLEIDPDDARGYRDLGLCTLYGGRRDESLEAFSQGERRNPQYADLLVEYANALQHSNETSASLEKINRAIELNPLGPDRYWWVAGGANFHLQRYREAIESMSRMRDPSPAFRLLAASWAMLGERKKAAEYVHKAKEIHPDFNVDGWLSILPIRDQTFAQHYEQGLREAGFK
jgi:tetratricopeptide (TPR) repeat protein